MAPRDAPPRQRRLVFGEVAELYDAARPTYPDALVDDLEAWARAGDGAAPPTSPRALEVGAGTGKATRLLTGRGVAVLAVEPSAEMAAVARRTTAGREVQVIESDFEHARLGERRFPLVYAAQAWHWVIQPQGYARARAALVRGGRLVAFWNAPSWEASALQRELSAVYRDHVPAELRGGVIDPTPDEPSAFVGHDWAAEIAGADGFGEPEVRVYDWSIDYTPDGYVDMLATLSETRLLTDDARASLLSGIRDAILAHGDGFTLPMRTRTCIARAV